METNVLTEQTKVCKKDLPISHFHRNSKFVDGLQYYCKDCMREANKVIAEK